MRPADRQLLGRLVALCRRERATLVEILLALVEVERRKLHVALGYSSLFAFATQHLHYSESAAGRRVQAARCVRDCPETLPLVRRGALNLSTLCIASRVLKPENRATVLARIAGKSQRDAEAIVSQYEPPRPVRERIRAVNVLESQNATRSSGPDARSQSVGTSVSHVSAPTSQSRSESGYAAAGVAGPPDDDLRGRGSVARATEPHFKIQFAARPDFMRKFEEARALLSGRFPKGASIESVFEAGLDAFLERNSPARRNERRKAREAKRAARMARLATERMAEPSPEVRVEAPAEGPAGKSARKSAGASGWVSGKASSEAGSDPSHVSLPQREWLRTRVPGSPRSRTPRRRAVPAALRDAIFERDGGRCTFVGVDGLRCGSSHDVEIDHQWPMARGGTNAMDNLRLLCSVHNRLEAERVLGVAWMRRFERS